MKDNSLKSLQVGQKLVLADRDKLKEDIHPQSGDLKGIRNLLKHWSVQHDYEGASWDGIEALHFELCLIANDFALESAGWYKYSSSTRDDMDGKDWRIILTKTDPLVCINCHSILHDGVWDLATTIHTNSHIDSKELGEVITHSDVWKRSMLLSLATAKILQTDGYAYGKVIEDMEYRLNKVDALHKTHKDIQAKIDKLIPNSQIPEYCSIVINDWSLPEGSIGSYSHKNENRSYGIITVDTKALEDEEYLRHILTHELIHAALGVSNGNDGGHDEQFNKIADSLGLPEEYRN